MCGAGTPSSWLKGSRHGRKHGLFGRQKITAAPSGGLLAHTAPLTALSWRRVFSYACEDGAARRASLGGAPLTGKSPVEDLRALLIAAVRAPVERVLAGMPSEVAAAPTGNSRPALSPDAEMADVIAHSAASHATMPSRLACLEMLATAGDAKRLRRGLATLDRRFDRNPGVRYLHIEALRMEGEDGRAFAMAIEGMLDFWGELAVPRLHQLATLCRDWGLPGLALPWLRRWLEQYPDGPSAGVIWLDRAGNASLAGLHQEARAALDVACRQLGAPPQTAFVTAAPDNRTELARGDVAP